MNIALLKKLQQAKGSFVHLDDLAPNLEQARRDLDELSTFGFVLEHHPYLGSALLAPAPRLCPDQIEHELNVERIGRRLAVWDRVESTNDLAIRASRSKANEGLVILAEEQSAGRGRRGRSWIAPRGSSLLMSTLLFPPEELSHPAWLTAWAAVAAADASRFWTGAETRIKWPNDLRVDGKKLCGVLVEKGQGAVVGLGLNVFAPPQGFDPEIAQSATCLANVAQPLGRWPLDRSEIARDLILRLDYLYAEALRLGPEPLLNRWRAALESQSAPTDRPDLDINAWMNVLGLSAPETNSGKS